MKSLTRKPHKRDNDYYLQRLLDEFPAICADLKPGKFKNTAAALIAAGLRKPRSILDHLRSAWQKASPSERGAFKQEIGCVGPASATMAPVISNNLGASASASVGPVAATSLIHADGRLSTDPSLRSKQSCYASV